VNMFLDKSLATMSSKGVTPIDDVKKEESLSRKMTSEDEKLVDKKWNVEDGSDIKIYDSSMLDLVTQRKMLWDNMMEERKTLRLYMDKLSSIEDRIFTLDPTEINQKNVEFLEAQWRSLEIAMANIRVDIAKMESQIKSITRRIFFLKNEQKMKNSVDNTSNKIIRSYVIQNKKISKNPTFLDILKINNDPSEYYSVETGRNVNGPVSDSEMYQKTDDENVVADDSNSFEGNLKLIVQKQPPSADTNGMFDQDQAKKVVVKLEDVIKEALSNNGIAEGRKVVEVKLITTNLPEGSEYEDVQLQNMLYTMMTGNLQGFEDIDNMRRDEENYNYVWKEEMMEDINEEIQKLKENVFNKGLADQMLNHVEQDKESSTNWKSIAGLEAKSDKTTDTNENVKQLAENMIKNLVTRKTKEKNEDESDSKEPS